MGNVLRRAFYLLLLPFIFRWLLLAGNLAGVDLLGYSKAAWGNLSLSLSPVQWVADSYAAKMQGIPPEKWPLGAAAVLFDFLVVGAFVYMLRGVVTRGMQAVLGSPARHGQGVPAYTDQKVVQDIANALGIGKAEAGRMMTEAHSPVPSEVMPRLWLGNSACSRDCDVLRKRGITAILNCTTELPNFFDGKSTASSMSMSVRYRRISVADNASANLLPHFESASEFITGAMHRGRGAVMVHCEQGVSRSATVVIAHLMRTQGLTLEQATAKVAKVRFIQPNETFLEQLCQYERVLTEARQEEANEQG